MLQAQMLVGPTLYVVAIGRSQKVKRLTLDKYPIYLSFIHTRTKRLSDRENKGDQHVQAV